MSYFDPCSGCGNSKRDCTCSDLFYSRATSSWKREIKESKNMALETKELKVLKLSEIPVGLIEGSWLLDCEPGAYHQAHICHLDEDEEIDKWIISKYPELENEDSFLVHIDVNLMKDKE